MSADQAFEMFSMWYERCLESGIEPEKIVGMMGGMALITDEELISRLQSDGEIPSF